MCFMVGLDFIYVSSIFRVFLHLLPKVHDVDVLKYLSQTHDFQAENSFSDLRRVRIW